MLRPIDNKDTPKPSDFANQAVQWLDREWKRLDPVQAQSAGKVALCVAARIGLVVLNILTAPLRFIASFTKAKELSKQDTATAPAVQKAVTNVASNTLHPVEVKRLTKVSQPSFDLIRKHYEKLLGDLERDVSEQIEKMRQEIKAVDRNRLPQEDREELEGIEQSLNVIEAMKKPTFQSEDFREIKGDRIRVPGDGNCLFHSMVLALRLAENHGTAYFEEKKAQYENHAALRTAVVNWLRDNQKDETVIDLLASAINETLDAKKTQLNDSIGTKTYLESEGQNVSELNAQIKELETEIKNFEGEGAVEYYLSRAQQNYFFASSPELYALSEIFKVCIEIEQEIDGKRRPDLTQKVGKNDQPVIKLVLSNVHYEPLIS